MSDFSVKDQFNLIGKAAVITGGAGLLGFKHAEAVAEMGGNPILVDIDADKAAEKAEIISKRFEVESLGVFADITDEKSVTDLLKTVLTKFNRIDILINNAANNPKMESNDSKNWSRLENYPVSTWDKDIAVGLTGAFLCSRIIGAHMADRGKGVILNIASDLGIIAPDQRIYRQPGLTENVQPVKPVTYSVVKHGLIGLTRYLATYWTDHGIRVNSLCPGGVYNGQDEEFVKKLTNLIPLGRMANEDEYKAAVVFMISDASSYMNGANVSIDGGRTVW